MYNKKYNKFKNKKYKKRGGTHMQKHDVEDVTISDVLGLASWDRERSSDELLSFVNRRLEVVGDDIDA